jgi:hypothetical protein
LGEQGLSSVSGIRRDNEVRVAEKTLTKLPVEEALSGWVIKKRGRVGRGEGKGGRDLERRIHQGVIESGEILIGVVDVDGVKIHFGWVPEGVVIGKVVIGVVEKVGGRKGGGFCCGHNIRIQYTRGSKNSRFNTESVLVYIPRVEGQCIGVGSKRWLGQQNRTSCYQQSGIDCSSKSRRGVAQC